MEAMTKTVLEESESHRSYRLIGLPTPFDPPAKQTTLATPSCCCCCCCCLTTVVTASTFHARDGYLQAREHDGRPRSAAMSGFLAPIAGFGLLLLGAAGGADGASVVMGTVGLIGMIVLSHALAQASLGRGLVTGIVSTLLIVVATIVEVAVVLGTRGIFWLLIPLFAFLGYKAASAMNGAPPPAAS